MRPSALSLLVLRTADLARSLRFYRALGLQLVEEQHGNGPVHYACELGATVLELYPAQPGSAPDRRTGGATMLGFRVDSLSQTMQALAALDVPVLAPPSESSTRLRALVQDPDGRAVEIQEMA
jgi:catechol 2,3-dioxygenase-like lactoylglutathione lyase family enzyme